MKGYEKNGNYDNMPLRCDFCLHYNELCVPRIDIVHPVRFGILGKRWLPICKYYETSSKGYYSQVYKGFEAYTAWLVDYIHTMRGYDAIALTENDPYIGIRGLYVTLLQGEFLYRLRLTDWMQQRYYDTLGNITRWYKKEPLDKRWRPHSDYDEYLSYIGKQGKPVLISSITSC